jgi:hypothetical protein
MLASAATRTQVLVGTQSVTLVRKTLHGPMAVDAIGIAAMRQACPHADAWLRRLEVL